MDFIPHNVQRRQLEVNVYLYRRPAFWQLILSRIPFACDLLSLMCTSVVSSPAASPSQPLLRASFISGTYLSQTALSAATATVLGSDGKVWLLFLAGPPV